ncbi:NB-ARC domain-containing protein [Spartinivicinus ruber]|uniref:NB-ARC domain-containing protein n=1 Tax=Spartinivicinus ruber TaxID=2683272 RepID=UPI0013D61A1C|nr:NB-ARC domain-containing protein [Spartinivicinus ruber]
MSESNLNRRKAGMLLFEIEESFGEYIKKKVNDIPNSVVETLQERRGDIKLSSIGDVLEQTYLAEVFQLALIATKNTSLYRFVNEISKLAVLYTLYEIRNAIAHPNRPFPNCYWYRLAAFASDPLISALGIQKIQSCLFSAEQGKINDPPDEWLDSALFQVRNNLPKQFEHDITGLIGREKESERLINLLTNPRVNTVAVIAPGGYGKTALVLDMLHQQITNPKTSSYADAIIFISLKTESLTINGIKKRTAPQTIEQLKSELTKAAEETYEVPFDNFEECKDYLEDQKLLVCIDNLETLLRDNPEAFNELNLELPPLWRILVTSRTMINSNQSITLEPLGKKNSIDLIFSYIKKRGGKSIGEKFSEKIAASCYYNPLAIRLSVDKIINGSAVQTAITSTKNEIAEFSFRNLIESLSLNSISVLEALLLSGEREKIYLCSLLQIDLDELSNAMNELIPTSLLLRKVYDDVELFDLSPSIRDLLLLETSNFSLREKILARKEKIERQASEVDKKQKELSISNLNVTHIPRTTNQSLKILLGRFHRCSKSDTEKMSILVKDFKQSYETFKDIDIFQREYSRLLSVLKDFRVAIVQAQLAVEIDKANPLNLYVLSDVCFRAKDYKSSSKNYLKLFDFCENQDIPDNKFLVSVYHGTFQSLLWGGDYEKIFELTTKWKDREKYSALFGGYRSTAYKRSVENSFHKNVNTYTDGLSQSVSVMNEVFKIAGYLKSPCIQSLKIFDEICYVIPKLYSEPQWVDFCTLCFEFIKSHYKGIIDQQSLEKHTDEKIYKIQNTVVTLSKLEFKNNPLTSIVFENKNEVNLDNIDSSYVEVRVYHIMKDSSNKFARDKTGAEYYLTKGNASGNLRFIWENISEGDRLFVKPCDSVDEGKAIPVTDIVQF